MVARRGVAAAPPSAASMEPATASPPAPPPTQDMGGARGPRADIPLEMRKAFRFTQVSGPPSSRASDEDPATHDSHPCSHRALLQRDLRGWRVKNGALTGDSFDGASTSASTSGPCFSSGRASPDEDVATHGRTPRRNRSSTLKRSLRTCATSEAFAAKRIEDLVQLPGVLGESPPLPKSLAGVLPSTYSKASRTVNLPAIGKSDLRLEDVSA